MSDTASIAIHGATAVVGVIIIVICLINLFYFWQTYNNNNRTAVSNWPGLLFLINILSLVLGIIIFIMGIAGMVMAWGASKKKKRMCATQYGVTATTYDAFGNPIPQVPSGNINVSVPQISSPPVGLTQPVQIQTSSLPTIPSTVDVF
jgi:uncharacterized membrane protein